jgi:hypothetical protein
MRVGLKWQFMAGEIGLKVVPLLAEGLMNLSVEFNATIRFTPLESPAARSGDDVCSFFSEHGV